MRSFSRTTLPSRRSIPASRSALRTSPRRGREAGTEEDYSFFFLFPSSDPPPGSIGRRMLSCGHRRCSPPVCFFCLYCLCFIYLLLKPQALASLEQKYKDSKEKEAKLSADIAALSASKKKLEDANASPGRLSSFVCVCFSRLDASQEGGSCEQLWSHHSCCCCRPSWTLTSSPSPVSRWISARRPRSCPPRRGTRSSTPDKPDPPLPFGST